MAAASILLLLVCANTAPAANDIPEWLQAVTAQKVRQFPSRVASVVMLREESVTVGSDGSRVMRERGAIKILQPGSERPMAFRTYNNKTGRIRDFQGWLLPPSGKPSFYSKERIVDVAVTDGVYEELRRKFLESDTAPPGSIFAWEVTEEEKTVFTQYEYSFQGTMPVSISRFSISLPKGWEYKAAMINRGTVEPKTYGDTVTWELQDLAGIEREDYSPPMAAIAPRLALSYFPLATNSGLKGLRDWTAVSSWLATLVDPPAEAGELVRAKAAQLSSAASGEIDKIRTIAAFVQQTKYVAVSLNLTRGGGYTPRKSDDVLSKNYGDCKDKATLMRALLKSVGVDSYLVTATADDRTYVHPEWASPMQFNHAIVAVRVSPQVALPSVVEVAGLGRLLMFDPTDSITPVGDLPEDEQGSYALVVAGSDGVLVKLPSLPASANRIESSVRGVLDESGRLTGRVERGYFGQSGVALRTVEKFGGESELRKRFELSYARRLPGTSLAKVTTNVKPEDNMLAVSLDLAADRFGQVLQGRLFVVRPGLLTSGGEYAFTSKQRATPIQLESDLRTDSIRIKTPAGFKLDELPQRASVESPYGKIQASWAVEDGEIVMQETLEIYQANVPASDYAKVRDFFDQVAGVHGAPVVFTK
jgi:transglutaminase-like putative cysteine protease